jgi:hypothetical protein
VLCNVFSNVELFNSELFNSDVVQPQSTCTRHNGSTHVVRERQAIAKRVTSNEYNQWVPSHLLHKRNLEIKCQMKPGKPAKVLMAYTRAVIQPQTAMELAGARSIM